MFDGWEVGGGGGRCCFGSIVSFFWFLGGRRWVKRECMVYKVFSSLAEGEREEGL